MNYVDIAIIAIIALFALIGLWKGFGKTFIKLFCFMLAIAATWFIASYALNWLLGVGFVRNLATGSGKVSLYTLYYNSLGEEVLNATAATKLDGAMGMFINPMIARFTALGGPDAYNITYAQFIALNLSINTLSVVLCLILYIVVRIVVALIAWILKKIFLHGEVRAWSRFVGFLFGAVRGAAVVMVALIVSTVVFPFGFASGYAETAGSGVIGKFACEYTYKAYDVLTYGGTENTEKIEQILASAGIEKVSLDQIKTDAIADLEAYKTAKTDAAEYSETGAENLNACVTNGKAAINAAENRDDVNSALETAKANIDAVLNKAQEEERDAAIAEKKAALGELKIAKIGENNEWSSESAYSEENFNNIKMLYSEGYMAIDKAQTKEQVESIYNDYAAKIEAVLTVNQENELAAKKAKSLTAFDEYVDNALKNGEYDEETTAQIENARTNGKESINAAANKDAVQVALDNAKAAVDEIINASNAPADGGEATTEE